MRLKLKTNIPGHRYGAIVPAENLGEDFARQLLDGDLAEEVEDESPADPVEALLHEVFELEDQIDGAVSRRTRIVLGLDGLDAADRERIEQALVTASRVRPELFGMDDLPDTAFIVATEQGFADTAELVDRAVIGRALLKALPEGFIFTDSPVEIVTLQANRIADLEAELAAVKAATPDNPPPPAEPSGDAAGASAPAAEPGAPPPAQPTGKPAGAAKAKKAGG